jgi:glyoxylase-like metal-dependent hydrolase (beta-lactamase superfamily II)
MCRRNAALIVEGHFEPAGAGFDIEAAESLARRPIRAAVATHFHFDHSFGTIAYINRRIPTAAHDTVTRLMKERDATLQSVDKSALLAPVEEKLARAAGAIEKGPRQADLENTDDVQRH